MYKKNMNANLQSITENHTARNPYSDDFDDYTPAIVKLARSSNKTTLDDNHLLENNRYPNKAT